MSPTFVFLLSKGPMRALRAVLFAFLTLAVCGITTAQTQLTAREYLKRGIAYLETGELDAAFAEATRAIELDPKLVGAYQLRFMVTNQKNPQTDNSHDSDMVIRLAPSAPSTAPYYV